MLSSLMTTASGSFSATTFFSLAGAGGGFGGGSLFARSSSSSSPSQAAGGAARQRDVGVVVLPAVRHVTCTCVIDGRGDGVVVSPDEGAAASSIHRMAIDALDERSACAMRARRTTALRASPRRQERPLQSQMRRCRLYCPLLLLDDRFRCQVILL